MVSDKVFLYIYIRSRVCLLMFLHPFILLSWSRASTLTVNGRPQQIREREAGQCQKWTSPDTEYDGIAGTGPRT